MEQSQRQQHKTNNFTNKNESTSVYSTALWLEQYSFSILAVNPLSKSITLNDINNTIAVAVSLCGDFDIFHDAKIPVALWK